MDARQLFQKQCSECKGTGGVDSGGFDMADQPISIGTCDVCEGRGTVLDRDAILDRIDNLQDTRDYAAPELQDHLSQQISILIDLIEPLFNDNAALAPT
jgi:hypothetical protein